MSNNWSYWRSSCNCFHALNKGWPKQQAVRSCQQVSLPLASTCMLQIWWSPHGRWSRFVCSAPSCFAATTSALHAWHFRNSWQERSRPAVLPWFSGFPESTQSTHCWSNRHKLKKILGLSSQVPKITKRSNSSEIPHCSSTAQDVIQVESGNGFVRDGVGLWNGTLLEHTGLLRTF